MYKRQEDTQAEEGETLDVIVYAWPYDGSVISDEPKDDGSDEFFFEDVSGWEKEYVLSLRHIYRDVSRLK